jgi:hypothetical protein
MAPGSNPGAWALTQSTDEEPFPRGEGKILPPEAVGRDEGTLRDNIKIAKEDFSHE